MHGPSCCAGGTSKRATNCSTGADLTTTRAAAPSQRAAFMYSLNINALAHSSALEVSGAGLVLKSSMQPVLTCRWPPTASSAPPHLLATGSLTVAGSWPCHVYFLFLILCFGLCQINSSCMVEEKESMSLTLPTWLTWSHVSPKAWRGRSCCCCALWRSMSSSGAASRGLLSVQTPAARDDLGSRVHTRSTPAPAGFPPTPQLSWAAGAVAAALQVPITDEQGACSPALPRAVPCSARISFWQQDSQQQLHTMVAWPPTAVACFFAGKSYQTVTAQTILDVACTALTACCLTNARCWPQTLHPHL